MTAANWSIEDSYGVAPGQARGRRHDPLSGDLAAPVEPSRAAPASPPSSGSIQWSATMDSERCCSTWTLRYAAGAIGRRQPSVDRLADRQLPQLAAALGGQLAEPFKAITLLGTLGASGAARSWIRSSSSTDRARRFFARRGQVADDGSWVLRHPAIAAIDSNLGGSPRTFPLVHDLADLRSSRGAPSATVDGGWIAVRSCGIQRREAGDLPSSRASNECAACRDEEPEMLDRVGDVSSATGRSRLSSAGRQLPGGADDGRRRGPPRSPRPLADEQDASVPSGPCQRPVCVAAL